MGKQAGRLFYVLRVGLREGCFWDAIAKRLRKENRPYALMVIGGETGGTPVLRVGLSLDGR